jgi:uncharacterized FAD-dependent dehydrogenase
VLVYLRRDLERLGDPLPLRQPASTTCSSTRTAAARGVRLAGGEELLGGAVVLGIGHSARDTYAMLEQRGVAMEFKPFQLGLRIEHPQTFVDRQQLGAMAGKLPWPSTR